MLANFPVAKSADVLVNLVGVAQNAALLYGAWRFHRREPPRRAVLVRRVAL